MLKNSNLKHSLKISNFKLKISYSLWLIVICYQLSVDCARAAPIDISIYPPAIEVVATPDSTFRVPLKITNHSDQKEKVRFSFYPFRPSGENGEISLMQDEAGEKDAGSQDNP